MWEVAETHEYHLPVHIFQRSILCGAGPVAIWFTNTAGVDNGVRRIKVASEYT